MHKGECVKVIENLSQEEIEQTHEIIRWAEDIANKYEIGLNTIINMFIQSRDILGDKEIAKQAVEKKLAIF